ncbi:L-rhamnose mutarotase [Sodalis-like endosymbiont of Proechinophthirus fluctus]|uniref:L-rhamnose mutarotase n=1 Tax=Sodalis-like endosymbiont of Proechinophthirus fluctus TaxID=1462730 RepID=UPI0034E96BB8
MNTMIKECNIANYSIYFKNGYLFSYYEYYGYNYQDDMKKWLRIRLFNDGGQNASPS